MEINIKVNIAPFSVPDCVQIVGSRGDGINATPKTISLENIDEYTLEKLCDDFRDGVFKKAGKQRPPKFAKG